MKISNPFKSKYFVSAVVLYFALAMIVPNIILLFSEGLPWYTNMANIMLPLGIYGLISIAFRKPAVILLASLPLMVLCAFQIVVWSIFKSSVVAIDMNTNIMTTNVSEATELLSNMMPAIIFVCAVYLPLIIAGIYFAVKKETLARNFRKSVLAVSVSVLLVGGIFTTVASKKQDDFKVTYNIFPVNIAYNIYQAKVRWDRVVDYYKTSDGFKYEAKRGDSDGQRRIFLFVIGEASRAASWQIYGYDRETNPLLSKNPNIVFFKDVLTESNTTHKSVPMLLSSVSAENYDEIFSRKSIITLFKEAGYHTMFISNQVRNRSLIDYFGDEADERIDVCPKDENLFSENFFDDKMLQYVDKGLESNDDLFIVVHMRGSHFNFRERYPEEFAHFSSDKYDNVTKHDRDKVINSYDNTILYTDYVLTKIIDAVKSKDAVSGIYFISDHGEDIMDDDRERFLHASPTTTYFQLHVPSFVWFSDKYAAAYPEKISNANKNSALQLSSAASFPTIATMANIDSEYVEYDDSPLDNNFTPKSRLYLNDYEQGVTLNKTGLKKQDYIQFEKRNIIP